MSDQMEVVMTSVEDQANMIRRLTSDLEHCHKESVKLMKLVSDVAICMKLKRNTNYDTIRALKGWTKDQLEVLKTKESLV